MFRRDLLVENTVESDGVAGEEEEEIEELEVEEEEREREEEEEENFLVVDEEDYNRNTTRFRHTFEISIWILNNRLVNFLRMISHLALCSVYHLGVRFISKPVMKGSALNLQMFIMIFHF